MCRRAITAHGGRGCSVYTKTPEITAPGPWPLLGEEQATRQECLSLLRTTATKSGFHLVTPFRQRWQAKVSARGKQRSLGVFDSPEDAAFEVLLFHIGKREPPASPTKPRNKRGEGRRPDSRHGMRKGSVRRQVARESPVTVTAVPLHLEVSDEVPAGSVVVPCYPVGVCPNMVC